MACYTEATRSPDFQSLPPELVAEIFWYTIPVWTLGANAPITKGPNKEFNVLVLGAVCQNWRKIAWTTPLLWTGVRLFAAVNRIATQRDLLEEWLSRSGDRPLDIALYCENTDEWPHRCGPSTLVDVANKYCLRWRSLLLQLTRNSYQTLPGPHVNLPLLTSLRLTPHRCPEGNAISLEGALEVREVIFDLSDIYVYSMKIPHTKITNIGLNNCFVDECFYILSSCPAITDVTFDSIGIGSFNNSLHEHLVVPHLSTFKLYQAEAAAANQLFAFIEAADLSELTYGGQTIPSLLNMCDFLSRCPKLLAFTLDDSSLDPAHLISLLQQLKTIKTFNLTVTSTNLHPPVNEYILNRLRPLWEGRKCLLPNLEEFKYAGPQGFAWSTFIETWKSRCGVDQMDGLRVAEWKQWDIRLIRPIPQEEASEELEMLQREACGKLLLYT